MQFPVTSGLESTLLQGKKKGSYTVNTVQIFFFCKKRCHLITASTKFSESGRVDIYDIMFIKLDAETRSTVKQLFGLKKADSINSARKVPQIVGYFPIATMTSLVFGKDPATVNYDQSKLQEYLVDCISQGKLSSFQRHSIRNYTLMTLHL